MEQGFIFQNTLMPQALATKNKFGRKEPQVAATGTSVMQMVSPTPVEAPTVIEEKIQPVDIRQLEPLLPVPAVVAPVVEEPRTLVRKNTIAPFKIIQTCDPISKYNRLLDLTSHINRIYAKQQGYEYEAVRALKYGSHPWHAIFNRIFILNEELEKGDVDWILYMDADAYVADLDERIESIIGEDDNASKVFLFCRGATDGNTHDINTGVFFINMRHPATPHILGLWKHLLMAAFPLEVARTCDKPWMTPGTRITIEDQVLLVLLFQVFKILGCLETYVRTYDYSQSKRFNYDGPYIRQILRPNAGTTGIQIEVRIERAVREIEPILRERGLPLFS